MCLGVVICVVVSTILVPCYCACMNCYSVSLLQGPAVHYKLYAVLVHSGYSCNSGHYYCFVKAANNLWYQMNDSSVSTQSSIHLFKKIVSQSSGVY